MQFLCLDRPALRHFGTSALRHFGTVIIEREHTWLSNDRARPARLTEVLAGELVADRCLRDG